MKTSMNVSTLVMASPNGNAKLATTPMRPPSPRTGVLLLLRLVEEAALEHPRAILRRQLHVARREEEGLVGNPLHAAVERIRETARKVDQPLRELRVGRLEIEDHGDAVLEPVRNLLSIVEAARQDEVDARRARVADWLEGTDTTRLAPRPQDARPLLVGLGIRPVVVGVVDPGPAGRQPADVGTLVGVGQLVLGEVAVLVPVLFLGDAEVDEGTGPDVGKRHGAADVSAATGLRRPGCRSLPQRRRPGSPGSFPSRARATRAARQVRGGGGSTAATPP